MKKTNFAFFLILATLSGLSSGAAFAADPALAARAQGVLKQHCASCHSAGKEAGNVFGDILDSKNLVKKGILKPGDADGSELIKQIAGGDMPPNGDTVSKTELDLLRQWAADQGRPDAVRANSAPVGPDCVPEQDLLASIKSDLEKLPTTDRKFMRYLQIPPGANGQQMREALVRVLNSLSTNRRLMNPTDLGKNGLLRIDLRSLNWDDATWEKLQGANPFASSQAKDINSPFFQRVLGTQSPLARTDWLIATATRPPLYHDILKMPGSAPELESKLGISVDSDIRNGTATRSGFRQSGVSHNNRVIERHESSDGFYWRSYDFQNNQGTNNVFAHPTDFVPSGGEIIFSLPNGMQAYMLVDGNGRRLDKAPQTIVNDPARPDHAVENGVSCMRCHSGGILDRGDEVRAAVDGNARLFSVADRQKVDELFVPHDRFTQAVNQDRQFHQDALAQAGANPKFDSVTPIVQGFEADVNLQTAACELDTEARDLLSLIDRGQGKIRELLPLKTNCSVARDILLAAASEVRDAPFASDQFDQRLQNARLARGPLSVAARAEAVRLAGSGEINPKAYFELVRDVTFHAEAIAASRKDVDPAFYISLRRYPNKLRRPMTHASALAGARALAAKQIDEQVYLDLLAATGSPDDALDAATKIAAGTIRGDAEGLYLKLRTGSGFGCGKYEHKSAIEAAQAESDGTLNVDRYLELVHGKTCHKDAFKQAKR